jgi:hypothetical protein
MPPSVSPQSQSAAAVTAAYQRPSRLLAGIYHDIGLAAVAEELKIDVSGLAPDTAQAVSRGVRYIGLMPKRQDRGSLTPIHA